MDEKDVVVSPWFFESWKAVALDDVVDAVADAVVEEDGEVGVDEVPHRHYHLLDP
jgi:hypothetical protein